MNNNRVPNFDALYTARDCFRVALLVAAFIFYALPAHAGNGITGGETPTGTLGTPAPTGQPPLGTPAPTGRPPLGEPAPTGRQPLGLDAPISDADLNEYAEEVWLEEMCRLGFRDRISCSLR